MRRLRRFIVFLSLSIVFSCGCESQTQGPIQLTTISAPQGGKIRYGVVAGATTQGAALTKLLSTIHTDCGEKPQIGKPFQFQRSNSVGVFFTVTDHPDGNIPLAGLVIANATGPNQMDGAMLYDEASRFGSTVNPLLQQLSSLWPAGGTPAAGGDTTAAGGGTPGAGQTSAPVGAGFALPPMRQVSLSDGTATVRLPAGWNIVPNQSALGQTTVTGPKGESLGLNQYYLVYDPSTPGVQNRLRRGLRFQNEIDYPTNADLTKSFADIFQKIRGQAGQGPAPLKVDSVQAVAGSQGQCVNATGQVNPDGTAMREMKMLLCRSTPDQTGNYVFTLTKCLLPLGATDQQRATADAIMASYKADMQRAQSLANAQSAPVIAKMQGIYQAHQKALMSFTQQQIANTRQIGQQATARTSATSKANSAGQASGDASQEGTAKNNQGFNNYLLDQKVIQNNSTGAHSTQWNSTADGLVQSNPNKYSYVSNSNLIPGKDF